MVLHNPNNWHWVNKDVKEWAREYLETQLIGLAAEEGDVSAKISKIASLDGDCDVSQRKGKVITLFDLNLRVDWEGHTLALLTRKCTDHKTGSTKDEDDVNGSINVPEVAHDTEQDEYVVCSLLSVFCIHTSSY